MSDTEKAEKPVTNDTSQIRSNSKVTKHIENDAGDGTRRQDQYLEGPKLAICVLSITLCMFLTNLDQTIVSTILDEVGSKFNDLSKVAWVMTGFLLPNSVLAANWGRFSIIFGRKYTMLFAVFIFEVGSLVCALSQSMNMLIGGRVLGGIGSSGISGLGYIIASEVTPINQRPFIFAALGVMLSVSVVIGPLIGGALASNVGWRWCFYINLPIGGFAAAFFFITFNPPRPSPNFREKLKLIDYVGSVLIAAALVLLLLGFSFASDGEFPWKSAAVICSLVIGSLALIAFGVWNFKYSKNPLIPKEVVAVPQVDTTGLVAFFSYFGFMTIILYLSLYFGIVFQMSPIRSGISLLAFIAPTIILAFSVGLLIGKTRYVKPYIVGGNALCIVGTGVMTLLDAHSPSSKRIGYLIVAGVGFGATMNSPMSSAQIIAPKINGGIILTSGFFIFLRSFGGALGTIMANLIYNTTLKSYYKTQLKTADDSVKSYLSNYSLSDISSDSTVLNTFPPGVKEFVLQAIMHCIRNVYYLALATSVCSFFISFFCSNKRIPKKEEIVTKKDRDLMDQEKAKRESTDLDVSTSKLPDPEEV